MKDSNEKVEDNSIKRDLITLADLHAKFGWEEYLVLAVTLSISALIGVFWAWRSRKVKHCLITYICTLFKFFMFFKLNIIPLLLFHFTLPFTMNIYIHYRNAQKTGNATVEYLLASRQMTLTPTTLSLACSFISAITLLGTPSEM